MKRKVTENTEKRKQAWSMFLNGEEVDSEKVYSRMYYLESGVEEIGEYILMDCREDVCLFRNEGHTRFLFVSGDIASKEDCIFVQRRNCLLHFSKSIPQWLKEKSKSEFVGTYAKMPRNYLLWIVDEYLIK